MFCEQNCEERLVETSLLFLLNNVMESTKILRKTLLEQLLIRLAYDVFRLPTFDAFASNSLPISTEKVNSRGKYNHC